MSETVSGTASIGETAPDSPSLRLRPILGRCSSRGWRSGVFSPGMMMPHGDSLLGELGVAFPLAEDTEGAVVMGRMAGLG